MMSSVNPVWAMVTQGKTDHMVSIIDGNVLKALEKGHDFSDIVKTHNEILIKWHSTGAKQEVSAKSIKLYDLDSGVSAGGRRASRRRGSTSINTAPSLLPSETKQKSAPALSLTAVSKTETKQLVCKRNRQEEGGIGKEKKLTKKNPAKKAASSAEQKGTKSDSSTNGEGATQKAESSEKTKQNKQAPLPEKKEAAITTPTKVKKTAVDKKKKVQKFPFNSPAASRKAPPLASSKLSNDGKYSKKKAVHVWVTQGKTDHLATIVDSRVLALIEEHGTGKPLSSIIPDGSSSNMEIKWESNGLVESVELSAARFLDEDSSSATSSRGGRRSARR